MNVYDFQKMVLVGGIYTVIRSKVPITKKEYGNNYICLGPYNDSFVKTEVEVGESKIDAIRETVNEMKRYGVHVRLGVIRRKLTYSEEMYRW